jgi:hypothetical protein
MYVRTYVRRLYVQIYRYYVHTYKHTNTHTHTYTHTSHTHTHTHTHTADKGMHNANKETFNADKGTHNGLSAFGTHSYQSRAGATLGNRAWLYGSGVFDGDVDWPLPRAPAMASQRSCATAPRLYSRPEDKTTRTPGAPKVLGVRRYCGGTHTER